MMTQTIPQPNGSNTKPTDANGTQNAISAAQPPAPIVTMTEAPYSWNVTVTDESGFVEQFTVRAISFEGFTQRVAMVKERLHERGYKPALRGGMNRGTTQQGDESEAAPVCAIHKTPMVKRQGKNGSFWSCPKRLDDETYCPYRPPKSK